MDFDQTGRIVRWLVRAGLGALVAAWLAAPAAGEETARGTPLGQVRVGVFDNSPIVFVDASGQPAGIAVDFLEDVAQRESWRIEYVHDSWNALLAALDAGRIDLLTGIAYTEERAERFVFTEQTLVNNWGIVYRSRAADISSLTDLAGKRVALMRRSTHSVALRDLLSRFEVRFTEVPVDTYGAVLQAIGEGRADAGAINRVFSLVHAPEYAAVATPIIFNPVEVRYAAAPGRGALVRVIDRHLAEQKRQPGSPYLRALDRWLLSRQDDGLQPYVLWAALGALALIAVVTVANRYLRGQVRRSSAKLRASEQRLRLALDAARVGTWEWDVLTGNVIWSDNVETLLGLPRGSFLGTYASYVALIRPDDVPVVEGAIRHSLEQRVPYHVEHRIVRPDGSECWLAAQGEVERDDDGRPVRMLGTVMDITERKLQEQAVRDERDAAQRYLDTVQVMIVVLDGEGRVTLVNRKGCELLGYAEHELLGQPWFDLCVPEAERDQVWDAFQNIMRGDLAPAAYFENRVVTRSGEQRLIAWNNNYIRDAGGRVVGVLGSGQDISESRRAQGDLRSSEERFSKAFHASPDAIMIARLADGRILEVNEGFESSSGFSAGEAVGRSTMEIGLWCEPADRARLLAQLARDGRVREFEIQLRRKTGEVRTCLVSAEPIEIAGEACLLSVTRDITERKAQLDALEYQAHHDSLTGLPNRKYLYARIGEALQGGGSPALLLMDLDRFKEINDTLGHNAGDTILKQVARRLSQAVDDGAQVARLGGDEFAILLVDAGTRGEVRARAEAALAAVRQPYVLEGLNVEIGASMGIAHHPLHGDSVSSLMRCADVAMYVAKQDASGCAEYDPELDDHTPRRLALTTELGAAIRGDQLLLHFQPKIAVSSGDVTGVEALVRWHHPTHGMIGPGQFIHLAEMSDLITPLTLWVVDAALAQVRAWRDAGLETKVAVNLSPRNLLDQRFPALVQRRLEEHALDPGLLEFEITESAMMADPDRALNTLWRLHDMGLRLSIDDFGTGYSSLSYLRRLPIQALKIDISFVRNMTSSEHDSIIVNSTINLAQNLGLEVVGEGVETRETLEALRGHGCDQAQGFYISRPLPAQEIGAWLRDRAGRRREDPRLSAAPRRSS